MIIANYRDTLRKSVSLLTDPHFSLLLLAYEVTPFRLKTHCHTLVLSHIYGDIVLTYRWQIHANT